MLEEPIPSKHLILYIAAQERSLGALCAWENSKSKEKALYYLSRTLVGAKHNYSPFEKICLSLMFVIQKAEPSHAGSHCICYPQSRSD